MKEMNSWERVLTAISRREPDRVPKTASFTPAVLERFKKETGSNNPAEYFKMEPRGVGFKPTKRKVDFSRYFEDDPLPPNASVSEWGTVNIPGNFYHFTSRRYVMARMKSFKELDDYPWPDLKENYRHEHLEAEVKRLHDAGYFVQGGPGHIFEIAWQLRGMDNLFMDFMENEEMAECILDHICELQTFVARRCAEAGVDMLITGDDVGMQDRLMMSPALWRKWFKPRWARVYAAARAAKPDIHIWYHSDGKIEEIIPDLIEIGLTVLNPVQPECMDPVALKKQYGGQLAFWGTIGTQTTMPFGTPAEVRATVRHMIETVGKGGGLVLAPTHVLEPDVPWENIVAFFEAVEEYGKY